MFRPLHGIKTLLVLGCFAVTPTFANAEKSQRIPLAVDYQDRMTVTVTIAGDEYPAVIDTAATYMLVDSEALTADNSHLLGYTVEVLGMDGKEDYDATQVGPVAIGGLDLGTVDAGINSKTRFIGHRTILPLQAFRAQSVDFDFQNNVLMFYDRRPKQPTNNVVTRVNYEDRNGLIFIPVKLNGKRGHALIDTGSDVTYVNTAFAKLSGSKLEKEKTRLLFGTAKSGVEVKVFSANRFQIGSHSMRQFDILAADPPVFDHLGISDEPVMVIGLDFLREFRFQIDRKNQAVLFGRQQPPGSLGRHTISPQHGRAPRY